MAKRTTQSTYQYEPLVTPANWQGDERRFSIRLTQLLDDLFGKYGTVASKVKALEKSGETPSDPSTPSISLLDVYPVGSIYLSTNEISPEKMFGGSWERLRDTFLLAAGDTYEAGSVGGEAEHTLIEEELPKITGMIDAGSGTSGESGGGFGAFRNASGAFNKNNVMQYGRPKDGYVVGWPSSVAYRNVTLDFGGDKPHNNMPPYISVYMWKRTA